MPTLQDFDLDLKQNGSKSGVFDLDSMKQADLLALHAKIEAKLTGTRLSDVNLERETLLQFQRAKALQELAATEKGVPMNQRAQVQNSLANLLTALAKMQSELHNSESIKRLRAAVVKTVKAQTPEFQAAFFELMERDLLTAEMEQNDTTSLEAAEPLDAEDEQP